MAERFENAHAKVDWFGEEVLLLLKEATDDGLELVALDVESEAKQNIVAKDLIDTGFMLNSVYHVSPRASTYGQAAGAAGMNPGADAHAEAALDGPHEALVAVAAEYGIWPEIKYGYLYPALETAAARAGGHLTKAAKDKGF